MNTLKIIQHANESDKTMDKEAWIWWFCEITCLLTGWTIQVSAFVRRQHTLNPCRTCMRRMCRAHTAHVSSFTTISIGGKYLFENSSQNRNENSVLIRISVNVAVSLHTFDFPSEFWFDSDSAGSDLVCGSDNEIFRPLRLGGDRR